MLSFNYCPICAGKLKTANQELQICTQCGQHWYHNPRPATCVILHNQENQILFTVRAQKPNKGLLDLPGGFISLDETVEQAAVRELKEELNLELTPQDLTYFASSTDLYLYQTLNLPILNLGYFVRLSSPLDQFVLQKSEISQVIYQPVDQIDYSQLASPGIISLVKQYLRLVTG